MITRQIPEDLEKRMFQKVCSMISPSYAQVNATNETVPGVITKLLFYFMETRSSPSLKALPVEIDNVFRSYLKEFAGQEFIHLLTFNGDYFIKLGNALNSCRNSDKVFESWQLKAIYFLRHFYDEASRVKTKKELLIYLVDKNDDFFRDVEQAHFDRLLREIGWVLEGKSKV